MLIEKKYFLAEDSQLNADDSPFAVSPNSWVNMENVRTKSTDKGVTGTVESIGGTLLLSQPQPSITFITIGGAEDIENSRFLTFKYCTTGPWHKIICWDKNLNQELNVLLSSQVTGGLNFSKDFLIQSRVENGLLYWSDDLNEPRRINIDAGLKLNNPSYITDVTAYTSPISQNAIYWIRRQPGLPVSWDKFIDGTYVNNQIKNEGFWFQFRYIYRDYEISTLSAFSLLANYNNSTDTSNFITITVPLGETIDQDVLQVDLCAKYANGGKVFIIKSWNKNIAADLADIIAHNLGTPLTFDFYNDTVGIALDDAYSVKPFDSLPIYALTIEIAKNRSFMANYIIGYDTPLTTSLFINQIVQQDDPVVSGEWIQVTFVDSFGPLYFLYIPLGVVLGGYFYISNPTSVPTDPYPYSPGQRIGLYTDTLVHYVMTNYPTHTINQVINMGQYSVISGAPPAPGIAGDLAYKSGGSYQLSISFLDHAGRKCGILTNDTLKTAIDEREYAQINYTTGINWTLLPTNQVNEIPIWAEYYSINITKCFTTRFFLQSRGKNITYVTKDVDGTYIFNTATYAANLNGVGIDITLLNAYNMGYVFSEGDFVKVYIGANLYFLAITGQQGNWIICELTSMGLLGDTGTPVTAFLFEIYTPYKPSTTEPYFEVAQIFKINNPGTINRSYSTYGGVIEGDITLLSRNDGIIDYLTENMSPNDKFYTKWNTDAGRPNFVDNIGQQELTNDIAHSDVLIQGTQINGLSSFDALNTTQMDSKNGSIQKLQLTSKVQNEQGVVMLAICMMETASLYLGEAQVVSPIGNAFLATSTDVIGTINILKGNRGTSHPESVTEYRGNVFWWDDINGRIVQYSPNGLFDISSYKMTRFWKLFSDQFLRMTSAEIEALGGRPFVFTTVDPYHEELLISIPKLLANPPKGYLPDYPEKIFPFDVYDGRGKTVVYNLSLGEGRPFWRGSFSFNPEFFITLQNNLYSSKYGHNYIHNQTTNYNEFYGIQYTSKIMIVANAQANKPKLYDNIASESNLVPSFVYMYNNFPIQQSSDLVDNDFSEKEGGFFSTIKRNKLVPTAAGYTTDGLLTGEKMRNTAMWIMFEWRVTTIPLELRFLNIGYNLSKGYNI